MAKEPIEENLPVKSELPEIQDAANPDAEASKEKTKEKATKKVTKPAKEKKAPAKKPASKDKNAPIVTADDLLKEASSTDSLLQTTSIPAVSVNGGKAEAEGASAPVKDPSRAKKSKEIRERRARRRRKQFVGLIAAVLILVGAGTIIRSAIQVSAGLFSNEDQKSAYETRIAPLVWFDLLPFETPSQIDEDSLKEALIFGIIAQNGNELQHDTTGSAIIPTIDVDTAAAQLFGPDFHFTEHQQFTSITQGITYQYDATLKAYIVAGTGLELPYSPLVTDVKNESGGIVRVTVGYVSAKSTDGSLLQTLDYDHPVKYMDFLFQRSGSEHYLVSMEKNTTKQVTTASESSSTSASSESDTTSDSASSSSQQYSQAASDSAAVEDTESLENSTVSGNSSSS